MVYLSWAATELNEFLTPVPSAVTAVMMATAMRDASLIAVAIITAVTALGTGVRNSFNSVAAQLR